VYRYVKQDLNLDSEASYVFESLSINKPDSFPKSITRAGDSLKLETRK